MVASKWNYFSYANSGNNIVQVLASKKKKKHKSLSYFIQNINHHQVPFDQALKVLPQIRASK